MKRSDRFTLLAILSCVCLIASNIFETKIFDAGPLTLTGGFIIFPISYILNDCITEIYGFRSARFVIWISFAMNAFFVLSAQLVRMLPPADYWTGQESFDFIFEADLRITLASMLAYLCGSHLNSYVMSRMKAADGEKRFCTRAVVSSLFGETIDSIIFFPIAFFGVGLKNIIILMVTQIVLKTLYEIILLPLTSTFVRRLRQDSKQS